MRPGFSLKISIISILTIGPILGIISTLKGPDFLYEAVVIIKRFNSQISGDNSELSKNRWIWARDGLEIKNRLQSETLANKCNLNKLPQLEGGLQRLNKLTIHYLGADENVYEFSLISPVQSQEMIESLHCYIIEMKNMVTEKIPRTEKNLADEDLLEIIKSPRIVKKAPFLNPKFSLLVTLLSGILMGFLWPRFKI